MNNSQNTIPYALNNFNYNHHHPPFLDKLNTIKSFDLNERQVDNNYLVFAFENEYKNFMDNYLKIQLSQKELEKLFFKESNLISTTKSAFFASSKAKEEKSFFSTQSQNNEKEADLLNFPLNTNNYLCAREAQKLICNSNIECPIKNLFKYQKHKEKFKLYDEMNLVYLEKKKKRKILKRIQVNKLHFDNKPKRKTFKNKNKIQESKEINCPYNADLTGSLADKALEFPQKHYLKKTLKCKNETCSKTFYKLKNYQRHLRLCQYSDKAFKCGFPGCLKSFSQIGNLKKHKLIHFEKKIYQCEFCEVNFTSFKKIRAHLKIHANEKYFLCNISGCGSKFKDKGNLKFHLKFVHLENSAQKNKLCCTHENCSISFKTMKQKALHHNKHEEECRAEKTALIRLIGKFKNTLFNFALKKNMVWIIDENYNNHWNSNVLDCNRIVNDNENCNVSSNNKINHNYQDKENNLSNDVVKDLMLKENESNLEDNLNAIFKSEREFKILNSINNKNKIESMDESEEKCLNSQFALLKAFYKKMQNEVMDPDCFFFFLGKQFQGVVKNSESY